MFYWKNTPGDCGSGTTITPSTGAAEELGTSGTAAVAGISAMAGAALPGAGSFISAIVGIFGANHAAAVAKEQSTLCGIMPIVNQLIAYCDNLVKTGQVSASDAVAGLQSAFSQINEQLATIEQPCNAACVYEGQFKAHAAFAAVYYPAIAPPSILPLAPGSAPAALVDAPGDVLTEAGAEVASITLGSSASGLSSTDYLAIGGILLAVIIFGIAAVL
jgi:hypothetical protein